MPMKALIVPALPFGAGVGVLRASTAVESYLLLVLGIAILLTAVLLWIFPGAIPRLPVAMRRARPEVT